MHNQRKSRDRRRAWDIIDLDLDSDLAPSFTRNQYRQHSHARSTSRARARDRYTSVLLRHYWAAIYDSSRRPHPFVCHGRGACDNTPTCGHWVARKGLLWV